jgi:hypothetical protein
LSLNTMLDEIAKLEAIRAIWLPDELLMWAVPKVVAGSGGGAVAVAFSGVLPTDAVGAAVSMSTRVCDAPCSR